MDAILYSMLAEITAPIKVSTGTSSSRSDSKEQRPACRRCHFMSDQHHKPGHHGPITYLIILLAAVCAFAALFLVVLHSGTPIMPAPG